ncbi:MAG TPA: LamG domain-containing protein [Streptosporangiaceae bacterium]
MKQSRGYRSLSARRSLTALAVTAGLVAAVPATAARAGTVRPVHGHAASIRSGARLGLTAALASARAKATGKPVVASQLTTATSQTTANPRGTFTVTESVQPVRAWRNGAWAALNPALRVNADGTLSPRVSTAGLVLSGGGTSPLAVMSLDGRSLAFTWPGRLPRPILSGPTATYRDALPGVDLVVTATAQGGFSDVLVVKNAAAAAGPRLARLRLDTAGTGIVITSHDGILEAGASPSALPVFTAAPPRMWDSARLPAAATRGSRGASALAARTGMPALSNASAPGAAAHITTVPVRVSSGAITLAPPAAALTGRHVSYPVYIDPTWTPASADAANWTQVDSGFPTTSYWRESSYLQSGLCPTAISPPFACNGLGVARSFFNMPIPSQLTGSSDIQSAYLYMTEVYAPSCTQESVRLYTTKAIFKTTTWKNQPTWSANYLYQDAAFGYPGCTPPEGYYKNDITWNVTSIIAGDAGQLDNQTFGLRAADETQELAWKQFWSGSGNLTMTVTYADPPNQPTSLSTSPGGSCQTNAATPAQIGDDSVIFNAYVSDNTPDTPLSTRFIIYNAAGTTVYDSATQNSSFSSGNDTTAQLPLSQAQMQSLTTPADTYHWHAVTTNDDNLTSSASQTCYFTYNPNGPPRPAITLTVSNQPVTTAPLGSAVTAQFSDPGCGSGSNPCPVSYTYQLGAAAPVTVSTSAGAGYVWSGPITVPRIGPIDPTLYATSAAGNPSADNQAALSGTPPPPGSAYPEGYFTGGQYPDLLMVGTGANQSLWLKEGTGNGTLGTPIDIGSMGTGINAGTAPGGGNNDGPTDWSDTEILQGNFTGHNVQDVMAYYTTGPHQGAAVILDGNGDSSPLVPTAGTSYSLLPGQFQCLNQDEPTDLAPAGNITGLGSDNDDLIGVCGNELDVYSDGSTPGYYSTICQGTTCQPLSTQSPDNDPWGDFTLATAEPGNDPNTVVIFALDNTTGQLWESTDSASTWSPIGVPWGGKPPTLLQGDINSAGNIELWTQSDSTDPSYTLSKGTLTEEYAQPTSAALGEWPLTDGNLAAQGTADTTAVNTITATTASLNGGAGWSTPSYFGTGVSLDGQSGYLLPPATTIPDSNTQPKISLWFNTTTPGGVLLSLQASPVTSGSTISGGYNPVLYIGTDGKLYAEWWNGSADPAVSTTPVDDGLWHHVILTAYPGSQNLYVDNQPVVSVTGPVNLAGVNSGNTNLTAGTGYIGGTWPAESHYKQSGSTGYLDYFQGQIADVIYSYPGGP